MLVLFTKWSSGAPHFISTFTELFTGSEENKNKIEANTPDKLRPSPWERPLEYLLFNWTETII